VLSIFAGGVQNLVSVLGHTVFVKRNFDAAALSNYAVVVDEATKVMAIALETYNAPVITN